MKCVCCDNTTFFKVYQVAGYGIYKCCKCGLEITPDINEEVLKGFYEEKYFEGNQSNYKAGEFESEVRDEKIEMVKNYNPNKVLEIGPSSDGGMAKYFDCYIHYVEPSKYASDVLIEKGCDVFNGKLYDDKSSGYDLCIATEVIEHDLTPNLFVKEVFDKLNKDGIFLLSTGNTNSLVGKVMGDKWFYRDPPAHVNYFNDENIKLILENVGFSEVKVYNYGFDTIKMAKKLKIKWMLGIISYLKIMTGMIIVAKK